MTRLSLCALAVALAAGHSLAVPSTVERAMHRFGDMEPYQMREESENDESTTSSSTTTTTTAAPTTESAGQWIENFIRAVQRQLQLQDALMRQLMKDILEYLNNFVDTFGDPQASSVGKVHEMLDMISTRMATAREAVNDVAANTENMEGETLRGATRKFMKEVRVQDVVVDALWASLRGVQTNAWMTGAASTDEKDTYTAANRAAEEFLTRMYHNLRSAGISEDDIVKFVPKPENEATSGQARNMGRKGWGGWGGYGYGYGYGYPRYGYGYGGYGGYGYGYPSYYSYGYYPYSYGYSYPYYSYPYYSYYYRRLRPTGPAPPTSAPMPPVPMTPAMMPPTPMMPPFRSMLEETMPMPPNTMMGQQGYPPMDYPMEGMADPMETMMPMNAPTTYYDAQMSNNNAYTYTNATRNLAPFEMPGMAPEPRMGLPPFGFGPPGVPF